MGRYSLVYHFRFCSCLFAFVKDIFFCLQENFLWNWSLSSEIQNCSFPNTHLVYRLYIFCNICRIWFLLTFTPMISVNAICPVYLQTLWRYVDFWKFLKSEAVWSTVGNCEAEYLYSSDSYYNIVAVQWDKKPERRSGLICEFFFHFNALATSLEIEEISYMIFWWVDV